MPDITTTPNYLRKVSISTDITQCLGNVPILRLSRLSDICRKYDINLKLESCNPGGSIKEKNAAYLVTYAEENGLLRPGGTIVESSSGNFGIGLAMIGAARGYRVVIVVDAKTPLATRRIIEAYGAELVDVPLSFADENGSMQRARMQKAKEIAEEIQGAWYPCQHLNPENPAAHSVYTAREIEAAFDIAPSCIVIGVSTAGQITGIGQYFKERFPSTQIVAVDVAGSAIFGTPKHPYLMTGVGLSFTPPNFHLNLIDKAYSIRDDIAFSVCRALARKEGLLLGASTGAIVAAALAYAANYSPKGPVVVINPDHGNRYLETVYNDQWLHSKGVTILSDHSLENLYSSLQPVSHSLLQNAEATRE